MDYYPPPSPGVALLKMQTQGQIYENAFTSGTFVPNANSGNSQFAGSSQPMMSSPVMSSPSFAVGGMMPTYSAPLSPSYGAVTAPLSPTYGSVPAPMGAVTSPVMTYGAPMSPDFGAVSAPVMTMSPTSYPVTAPVTTMPMSPTTYAVPAPVTQPMYTQGYTGMSTMLGPVEEVTNYVPMQVVSQVTQNVPITAPLTYVEPTPIYEAIPEPSPPPPPPVQRVAPAPAPPVQRAAPPPVPPPEEKPVKRAPLPTPPKARAAPPAPPPQRPLEVERIVEKIVNVPHEVEVERIVYQDKIVEVPVEKIVTVDRMVEVPVEVVKIVTVPVEKIVQVPVDRIVEKIVDREVPVTVERRVEVPVPYPVDRIVEKIVEVPVEKIVYKEVPVPVQMSPERVVVKEVPVPVEVVREVPVPVEKVIYKEVPVGVQMGQHMEIRQHERVQVGQREQTFTDGPQYALAQYAAGQSPQQPQIQYQTSPSQFQQYQSSPQQMFTNYQSVQSQGNQYQQFQTSPSQGLYNTNQLLQSSPGFRNAQQFPNASPPGVYSSLPGDMSNLSLRSPGFGGTNLYGSQQGAAGSKRVGLGLVLERNEMNRSIVIRDMVPDFAAHRSGKVQRGDILLAVDAEPTTGYDLDQIKYLTSGEDGSQVMLDLLRNGARVQVPLVRSGPGGGGMMSMASPSGGGGMPMMSMPSPSGGGGMMQMTSPETGQGGREREWGGELAC